jgi:hypothetical protein
MILVKSLLVELQIEVSSTNPQRLGKIGLVGREILKVLSSATMEERERRVETSWEILKVLSLATRF